MDLEPFVFRHDSEWIGLRACDAQDGGEQDVAQRVNAFALRPLEQDEFAVFTLDLCHNQVDRHFSRFPDEELEKIDRMVLGRPLMERHDLRGSLPRGTFFHSRLHRDGERLSVRPDVYVLRTDENRDFILNIEGGVYRETSIAFSFQLPECSICSRDLRTCDHVPGRSYGGEVCHFIMRNVLEVIEGSVVPSGSQGTRFVPRETRGLSPAAALAAARDTVHEPIELFSLTAARSITEALHESKASPEHAANLIRDGVAARRRAVARFCGLGRELDGGAFEEDVWRKTLAGCSLDEIHAHLRAYEVRFDEKHPPQPVSRPAPLENAAVNEHGRALEIVRGNA